MLSIDPASLVVSWQPPLETHCNGSITGYLIQYAKVGSDDNMIVNVPNDTATTTLTISGLYACVEYSVTVAAVNANGTGPFSKPVVATSGEDGELNNGTAQRHHCNCLKLTHFTCYSYLLFEMLNLKTWDSKSLITYVVYKRYFHKGVLSKSYGYML